MNVVLPVANELDPQHGLIPEHVVSTMAEMGLFGILVPEEYGGLGLGLVEYCMVTEELARAWMSVASIIARGNGLIAGFSAAQREAILPRVARGEYLGAFALSEPDAGSDIASIRTRAERDGDEWVITGQKMWCTYADQADYLIVVARTTPYDPLHRHAGIRRFYVPKERGTLPARRRRHADPQDRILRLADVGAVDRRPARAGRQPARRARTPGTTTRPTTEGFREVSRTLTEARVHTGARAIGWRAARSRTRSPTASSAGSSTARSATSRRCGSRSPRWRPRSRPAGRSCTRSPPMPTPGSRSTIRRRCSSSSPARWPNG